MVVNGIEKVTCVRRSGHVTLVEDLELMDSVGSPLVVSVVVEGFI